MDILKIFNILNFNIFKKTSKIFIIFSKNIFSEKFFEFLKKYFVFRIFCVTRYGYVVCKNYTLSNLQASQQRTARHTLKTSRILADSFAVPHRDVLLLFTHLLLRNNMDNLRRMNISYRNNGRIIIHHGDSSKTNLNHFPTNYELIPSIIHDDTYMYANRKPGV